MFLLPILTKLAGSATIEIAHKIIVYSDEGYLCLRFLRMYSGAKKLAVFR